VLETPPLGLSASCSLFVRAKKEQEEKEQNYIKEIANERNSRLNAEVSRDTEYNSEVEAQAARDKEHQARLDAEQALEKERKARILAEEKLSVIENKLIDQQIKDAQKDIEEVD